MKKEKPISFGLKDVKCPVCKNPINKTWSLGGLVAGHLSLLAECAPVMETNDANKPRHLFVIHLNELPSVRLNPKDFKEESDGIQKKQN